MALAAGAPAVLTSLLILWLGDYTAKVQWTLSVLILGCWLGFSFALRERAVFSLQTLSNLLAALREGDFSIRARGAGHDDALGEVVLEVNELGDTLREQRLGALEASNLLRTVMAEIEVAVVAVDGEERLVLVNGAAERLLAQPAERLLGRYAKELGLAECLTGPTPRLLEIGFPGGRGRWELHRSGFWQGGRPHQLLVLSDLSRALREEEQQAWQRLIRVLGHELNNSLTPIHSLAGSLRGLLSRSPRAPDWEDDLRQGLGVIAERSKALSRFMSSYTQLTRLPPPKLEPIRVDPWVRRVVGLEVRQVVVLRPGPDLSIRGDGDQLDQLLINLVRNAVDAALETGGAVEAGWRRLGKQLEVWVEDEGPGLPNTTNLFVPFFTTKPGGSGIGLVLSRQIAENHGGSLTLENRRSGRGCRASLRL